MAHLTPAEMATTPDAFSTIEPFSHFSHADALVEPIALTNLPTLQALQASTEFEPATST